MKLVRQPLEALKVLFFIEFIHYNHFIVGLEANVTSNVEDHANEVNSYVGTTDNDNEDLRDYNPNPNAEGKLKKSVMLAHYN